MNACTSVLRQAGTLFLGAIMLSPAAAASCDEPAHRAFDFWLVHGTV